MLSIPAAANNASMTAASTQRSAERSGRECPRCASHSVARSRIRGWMGEAAKRVLGVRPYRCLDCWHRFVGVARK